MVSVLRPGNPVYCLRPAALRAAADRFRTAFPGRTLYAVKCNPHPVVLETFYAAGIEHFDAASIPEIAAVRALGSDAAAHYMHPVKTRDAILTAYTVYGVRDFAVDHPDELEKILYETNHAKDLTILVRFATPGGVARYELSQKFGADEAGAAALLRAAVNAGCRPGLAFHVGSQCLSPAAYRDGIRVAGKIAEQAGVALEVLDIGGGFPGVYPGENAPPPLEEYFAAIRDGFASIGAPEACQLVCEPGRAMVASGCSIVVQVQLRKESAIYINDGIYHSLSETVTGNLQYPVRLIRAEGTPSAVEQAFTVFGPTCDSTDVLPAPFRLPDDVREGDWIEIDQTGAYTNALVTGFNGIAPSTFVIVE
ncbi:MAG: type III PLP-dependent enzyme [Alphaproteobacteria bacterium]|nr:type III PLP-dependent enzyme [Alphaproteobacteria bacterium]